MILLIALTLSLLVALMRGGQMLRLGSISFRYGWLALLAFGLQVIERYTPALREEGILTWRNLLLLISYGLLIVVVFANRALPGMALIGLGLLLNLAVMVANGGFMPVTPQALQSAGPAGLTFSPEVGARLAKDIILAREDTVLWMLSDILVAPQPLGSVFSIGDVVLASGAFHFLQQVMVVPRARRGTAETV